MKLDIRPSGQGCGASVRGIDLRQALHSDAVQYIRDAWLEHHVLSFPDQSLSDEALERFTLCFGPFGADPFIAPIPGREHVIAIERRAGETASLFAEAWHTDWSFQAQPPSGTCLYAITVPPVGGNTLFANQHRALDAMPARLRKKLEDRHAVHSAQLAYAPDGLYGESDQRSDRSMTILPSDEARQTRAHPMIRRHSETGREGIFGCLGYVIGIEGMNDADALPLLQELLEWQTQPQFVYEHQWAPGTLIMWDNRSVLHKATGGYEGHDRLLHRTTIGSKAS